MAAIGFAFEVLAFLVILIHFTLSALVPLMWPADLLLFPVWAILAVAILAMGALGLSLAKSEEREGARMGYVLILIFSIIAFPLLWGFVVGSVLAFIGGIVGLLES